MAPSSACRSGAWPERRQRGPSALPARPLGAHARVRTDRSEGTVQAIDERTGLERLDEAECWRLLRAGVVGRLAVGLGRGVDIFPVNYLVHRGDLLVRTVAGTKLAGAVLGGPVAFEVDEVDPVAGQGWSVVAHGRAEELTRLEAVFDAEDTGLEAWAAGAKDRWLVVHVDDVSGRRLPDRR